ncbi:hypothetical protein [Micromonospora sp. DT233]|uniref:hypothetical protein n=1 Tax=Micromonospora sp. DT233 TaxID=3393432 RepID=UPI003CF62B38
MSAATWRAVGRAFPGPVVLAVWALATVPAPLIFFEATHRWEEDPSVSSALWWVVGAVPVLAAVAAARWTRRTDRAHPAPAALVAVVAATLVSAVFVGATLAVYRWVVPLSGAAPWRGVLAASAALAVGGAAIGHLLARGRVRRRSQASARRGYVTGAIAVVLGALFAQTAVQLGAEGSTASDGPVEHGPAGQLWLPAADRYAIFAEGFSPSNPDCRVTGPDGAVGSASSVSVPPGGYGGGDATTYTWVASFDVPAPGSYSVSCRSSDPQASYVVGEVPRIRGAVGSLIHWPLTAIWLLGAVPGLLIIAAAVRRRTGGRRAAAPPCRS